MLWYRLGPTFEGVSGVVQCGRVCEFDLSFKAGKLVRLTVMVIRVAPRISTKVIGMNNPKKVNQNTLCAEVFAGSFTL